MFRSGVEELTTDEVAEKVGCPAPWTELFLAELARDESPDVYLLATGKWSSIPF
jgi:hypothetical protein